MPHHKIPSRPSHLAKNWRDDWKSIFIPNRFELGVLAAWALASYFACGESKSESEIAWGCFRLFCTFRACSLVFWIWKRLSPRTFEAAAFSPLFWGGMVGLFFAPALWRADWQSLFLMRPSGNGALWVVGFGLLAVLFFWPLMWSLDRVFKPYAARTGQNVLGALGFLVVSGVWWSGLVFGVYVLGSRFLG